MYRPNLEEILRGALAPAPTTDVHYVTTFRYPTYGGFGAYIQPLAEMPEVRLGHEVVGIDAKQRQLRFAGGGSAEYAQVISSIPLPDLIAMIDGAPADVLESAKRLAFTSTVLVNLGIDREDLSDGHITYFYDSDIIFPRISFPHMFSPKTVPPGAGSIQVETYFSDKYKPLRQPPKSLIDPVLSDLRKTGVLRDHDHVVFSEARVARYANVIYDLERAEAVKVVHGFLDDIGVLYCGRYGDWNHEWTDEAFVSGEQAAQTALKNGG
jgi:protoporphyrinogen oxidase